MPNPENVTKNKIKKGEIRNPTGRPRKLVSTLMIEGYRKSEIVDTIEKIVAMRVDELKQIFESKESTILEKIIANSLKKSLEKGNLDAVETLLNRVHGKPKESIDHNVDSKKDMIFITKFLEDDNASDSNTV
jgi:tRNA A37 N6-isopentenylltransferase MiaA